MTFAIDKPDKPKFLSRLLAFLASLAAVATIILAATQLIPSRPALRVEIVDVQELTSLPEVSGLTGAFFYNGAPVDHLSLVRLRVVNVGRTTIIGMGARSDILDDVLMFRIDTTLRLLDFRPSRVDFDGSARVVGDTAFAIDFGQWKVGELLEARLYLEGEIGAVTGEVVAATRRTLIDGDITSLDVRSNTPSVDMDAKPNIIRRWGGASATLARAVGFISLSFGVLLLAVFEGVAVWSWAMVRVWNRQHHGKFALYLTTLQDDEDNPLTSETQSTILSDPRLLPDNLWPAFPGRKYPSTSDPITGKQVLWFTAFSLFVSFGSWVMLIALASL